MSTRMDPSRSRALVYSMITADDLCWPVTTPSQAGGSLMGDGTESMVDEGKELLCPNLGAPRRCSGRGGAETSYDERLQRLFSEWPPQEVLGVKSGAGHALPPVTRLPWPGSTSVDNVPKPDAAQTPLGSTVQSTWRAQAALELAARAAAILVERAPHPTAATTQAPLPAAPKTRADPAHAAHQSLKTGVLASLGCVASTHDASNVAGGSQSRAPALALAFQEVQLQNGITKACYLLHNLSGSSSEVGRDTCDALTCGATRTTELMCALLQGASSARCQDWRGAIIVAAAPHDRNSCPPDSAPAQLASAVARGCHGSLRLDLLTHSPHQSARATPLDERRTLLANAYHSAPLPADCKQVIIVDDNFHTCSTAESIVSALIAAAGEGRQLTFTLVCAARCVRSTKSTANAHLPMAVRKQLITALDLDAAAAEPQLEEGQQQGVVYQQENYVGSTVRREYGATYTAEGMVGKRAQGHLYLLDRGIHHSPKHQAQAEAYLHLHGKWPPFAVLAVLRSSKGETWSGFKRRVIREEQWWLDELRDARSNASPTAGRPRDEDCAKGGRKGGKCGGKDDYRVVDAAEDLCAAEQACASAQEAARGAPHNLEVQAALEAAELELAEMEDRFATAKAQQAATREGKVKAGGCGGKDDFRVHDAAVDLQAKEQPNASAQEAAFSVPQDPGLQAVAAAAAAALDLAQAAHQTAQQQKAQACKGKQSGGRNGHPAKGPNTQACKGCGKLGGSWRTCPRNPESAKRSDWAQRHTPVHEDGPGEPGKRWGRTQDVYAERLAVASTTAVAAQPQPRGMKRLPPLPTSQPSLKKICGVAASSTHPPPLPRTQLPPPPPPSYLLTPAGTYKNPNWTGSRLRLPKPLPPPPPM